MCHYTLHGHALSRTYLKITWALQKQQHTKKYSCQKFYTYYNIIEGVTLMGLKMTYNLWKVKTMATF